VESVLANLLSLAISFLANFAGLGKVADKIMEVIEKVRDTIDKALESLVKWIVTMAKKLFSAVKAGVKKLVDWWNKEVPLEVGSEKHTLKFDGSGPGAKLAVFSDKKEVSGFVKDFLTAKGTKADVDNALALDAKIMGMKKQLIETDEKKNPALFESLSKELSDTLDV